MKTLLIIISLSFVFQPLFAQYQIGIIPRVSPDRMISQKIGFTNVEIRYGSPSVKDRVIWGELVPYDEVWRAGANSATTIELSTPIDLGETVLDTGRYALFIIPQKDSSWTLILNSVDKQWGAFKYDETKDVVRVMIEPIFTTESVENLSYSLEQSGYDQGEILIQWDKVELRIPFTTNYLEEFEKQVESRAAAQPDYIKWVPYIQGAEHLMEIDERQDIVVKWLDNAERIMLSTSEWNEQFYPREYVVGHLYWSKAKSAARLGHFSEAAKYVKRLKALGGSMYYSKNKREIDQLRKH